jgi:hypothetical protein
MAMLIEIIIGPPLLHAGSDFHPSLEREGRSAPAIDGGVNASATPARSGNAQNNATIAVAVVLVLITFLQ